LPPSKPGTNCSQFGGITVSNVVRLVRNELATHVGPVTNHLDECVEVAKGGPQKIAVLDGDLRPKRAGKGNANGPHEALSCWESNTGMAKVASELFEGFGWSTGGLGCLVQLLKERLNFFSPGATCIV
jgi:hypothetical protein